MFIFFKERKKYTKLEIKKKEGSGLTTGDCSVNHVSRTTALLERLINE